VQGKSILNGLSRRVQYFSLRNDLNDGRLDKRRREGGGGDNTETQKHTYTTHNRKSFF
jgi:hypothetical protein